MASNINPFVYPQGPSAPISTSYLLDEANAVDLLEKDASSPQRVIVVSSAIPLVFCKFSDNKGGAWVSPPAARYGLQLSDTQDNLFSFGMVVSDGKIGVIADEDVYKGTFALADLTDTQVTNAFGEMPTTGFNYSFTSETTEPGSPGTEDTTNVVVDVDDAVKTDRNAFLSPVFWERVFRFTSISSLSFTLEVVDDLTFDPTVYPFLVRVYRNRTLLDEIFTPVTSYNFSHNNNGVNDTYEIELLEPPDISDYPTFVDVSLSPFRSTTHRITTTPGEPATPPTYTTVGLPLSPGSGGTFTGMSCLAVRGTYTQSAIIGDYREQVRCFVRNGVEVKNLSTDTIESSNNFIDLAYYLLKVNNVSDELIDLDGMLSARNFLEINGLRFNGVLSSSVNLRAYFEAVAPGLLLRFVQNAGRFSFKPVLPLTTAGNLDTASIPPVKVFTQDNVLVGSFTKNYYSSQLRKPICVLLSWRDQFSQAYSVTVTTEIRYLDTAIDGPFETYDFSDFITDIDHASLVGKYILSSRARTTHSVRFSTYFDDVVPGQKAAGQIEPLDIIRLNIEATTQSGAVAVNGFYQVSSISEAAEGVLEIEAIHFPADDTGASLVIADMLGTGYAVT